MRYLLSFLILMLNNCTLSQTLADTPRSFLGLQARRLLLAADQIHADNLYSMRFTPRAFPLLDRTNARRLNSEQRKEIVDLLSQAEEIDPELRLSTCRFEPGVAFTLVRKEGSESISFLLCFNCDVWAISNASMRLLPSPSGDSIVAFGDAKKNRAQLVKIVRDLFPDIRAFQMLDVKQPAKTLEK